MNCTYIDCVKIAIFFPEDKKSGFALCNNHQKELEKINTIQPFDVKKLLSFWVKAQGGAQKATERMMGKSDGKINMVEDNAWHVHVMENGSPIERIKITSKGEFYINQQFVIKDLEFYEGLQKFWRMSINERLEYTFQTLSDNTISFHVKNDSSHEVLRIQDDVFIVEGVVTTDHMKIYNAFRNWLILVDCFEKG